MTDLKPCERCGRMPVRSAYPDDHNKVVCTISCPDCRVKVGPFEGMAAATAAWNRRAPTAAEKVVEAARALLVGTRTASGGDDSLVRLVRSERLSTDALEAALAAYDKEARHG